MKLLQARTCGEGQLHTKRAEHFFSFFIHVLSILALAIQSLARSRGRPPWVCNEMTETWYIRGGCFDKHEMRGRADVQGVQRQQDAIQVPLQTKIVVPSCHRHHARTPTPLADNITFQMEVAKSWHSDRRHFEEQSRPRYVTVVVAYNTRNAPQQIQSAL